MLKFKKVIAKNFMCFEDIEVDLEKTGLVLLEGINNDSRNLDSNGAGKSVAIVDTIFYSLYGRTLSGLKASEVVMWNKKDCYNEIQFEYDDKEYQVKRKRSGNNIDLKLIVDEKDLSSMDSRMTQKDIDNIISYDVLRNTTVFSGSVFNSFVVAGDKEKKAIISSLLGLELLEERKKYTKELYSNYKNKIAGLEGRISSNMDMIESTREELVKTTILDKELEEEKSKLKKLDTKINKLINSKESLQEEIKKKEDKQEKISISVDEIREQETEITVSITKENSSLSHIEKEISEIKKVGDKTNCPTCKQKVNKSTIKEYIDDLKEDLVPIQKRLRGLEKQQKDIKDSLEQKIVEKRNLNTEINKIVDKVSEINKEMSSLKDEEREIEIELRSYENKKEHLESLIKKAEKEIEKSNKEKEKYEKQMPIFKFWIDGFSSSGIINFILDLSIPELNKELNRCLSYLFGGDVVAKFKPFSKLKSGEIREKWDFDITGLGSYKSCSSGQKRRLDISVLLALNTILRKRFETNLIVFDEALDPLDGIGIEKTIELIKNLKIPSTFLITHSSDLKGYFNTIWIAEKTNGVSKLIK